MDELNLVDDISEMSQQRIQVKRFYKPGVLAAYCILANIPLAIFLYGINVHRRGDERSGNIIKIFAAFAIVAMTIALPVGSKLSGLRMMLPGIVIGMGIMQIERPKYERAISQGAMPEKWWPPLLFLIIDILVVFLIDYLWDLS